MDIGEVLFPVAKRPGREAAHSLHLVTRLRMSVDTLPLLLCTFMVSTSSFSFYSTLRLVVRLVKFMSAVFSSNIRPCLAVSQILFNPNCLFEQNFVLGLLPLKIKALRSSEMSVFTQRDSVIP